MARPRWKSVLKPAVKLTLAAIVLLYAADHVRRTRATLAEQGRSIRIDAGWIALGVGLYLAGLCGSGLFYGRLLRASATPVSAAAALRAYLISHLGKYSPGKALVVVMRVALVTPYGARPATAAFATLYETFVMMAAGGLAAAVGFAVAGGAILPVHVGGLTLPVPTAALGLALGLAFLAAVLPPVFPRIAALLSLPFPNVGPNALPRLTGPLLTQGLALTGAGWVLLGLSQVAVLRAILPAGVPPGAWAEVVAGVALATVAGFAVPIAPGGLGVRETVLWTTLEAVVDRPLAVVAALALRLTWVIGELCAAGLLWLARPALPRPVAP